MSPFSLFQKKDKSIPVFSPLTGSLVPLDQVQDPVFADRLLGDGIAILPDTGEVYAPADGIIGTLPPTAHAIPLQIGEAQLLIHVGLETVQLGGRHFKFHCEEGEKVRVGQLLLTFDLDAIRKAGYNTVTPVVVSDAQVQHTKTEGKIRKQDLLFRFVLQP